MHKWFDNIELYINGLTIYKKVCINGLTIYKYA